MSNIGHGVPELTGIAAAPAIRATWHATHLPDGHGTINAGINNGVLTYEPELAARIDAGELLPAGGEEREIRGCAVHACELLSERLGMPPRLIDVALWTKGQAPRYKSVPRHRCRTVFY